MIIMSNKNISWLGIVLMLSVHSFVQAKEVVMPKKVWNINRATVDLYKGRIKKQLARNKIERVAVLCAATAVIAALGWYTVGGFSNPSPAKFIPADQLTKEVSALKDQIIRQRNENHKLYKFSMRLMEFLEDKYPGIIEEQQKEINNLKFQQAASTPRRVVWSVWDFFKSAVKTTANNFAVILLMGGLPGPINKMFGFWGRKLEELGARIYHDNDFYWFVSTQTRAIPYFEDLERSAALLPLANDQEERDHQKQTVLWSSCVLTKQLARIVAFMEFQSDRLKILHTGCGIQMQASARYVYRHVGLFAEELQRMLDDSARHAEIPAYVATFREQLRSEQDSFCTNERAALFDISDDIK